MNKDRLENKVFKPSKTENKTISHEDALKYAHKNNLTTKQAYDRLSNGK